jgi:hypothetical protein
VCAESYRVHLIGASECRRHAVGSWFVPRFRLPRTMTQNAWDEVIFSTRFSAHASFFHHTKRGVCGRRRRRPHECRRRGGGLCWAILSSQELFQPLRRKQTGGQPGQIGSAHWGAVASEGADRARQVTAGDSRALRDGADVLNDLRGPV